MSVLIKGMKMPNNCGECVLCNAVKDDEYDYEINTYCHDTGESLESLDVRGDRCPLVEVPTPHGRLIDANQLLEAMYHRAFEEDGDTMWQSGCWVRYRAIEKVQDAMPTIIEAEE